MPFEDSVDNHVTGMDSSDEIVEKTGHVARTSSPTFLESGGGPKRT